MTLDEILDEPFFGCAFEAFIAEAVAVQSWPHPEKTRQRAYRLYEEELAERSNAVPEQAQQPLAHPHDPAYSPRDLSKGPAL